MNNVKAQLDGHIAFMRLADGHEARKRATHAQVMRALKDNGIAVREFQGQHHYAGSLTMYATQEAAARAALVDYEIELGTRIRAWYIVSPWLAMHLRERGEHLQEVVTGTHIWGSTWAASDEWDRHPVLQDVCHRLNPAYYALTDEDVMSDAEMLEAAE